MIFEQHCTSLKEAVNEAVALLEDYQNAQGKNREPNKPHLITSWSAPEPDSVKLNVD